LTESGPDLSQGILVASGIYVILLIGLGIAGRRAKQEKTLTDHFLASRSIGLAVLLLTLFATQYSGNSVSGFPGQTYRQGLAYIMSVTFMVGIVSGYLLLAPRLFAAGRLHRFLTPTDYLEHRFGSPLLSTAASIIFTITLCNYLLAQLIAMGHAFSGLSDDAIPYAAGVVGGAVVILFYELMGGMRAVAWTDVLQGGILLLGLAVILVLLIAEVGSPAAVIAQVTAQAPAKTANPGWDTCRLWLSNFLLLGLGAPLYPQAIQRFYAARRLSHLRRALATMAFLPLFAVTTVVFIGMVGIGLFPGLEAVQSDSITFRVLAHLVERQPLAYLPVLVVTMAVLAAIMSTADSALLSLASILTKDFLARIRRLGQTEADHLTRFTPVFSILVMALLVMLALRRPTTLWALLVIKFEILIQLSPAFVLGTLHDPSDSDGYRGRDILAGLVVGLLIALSLYLSGNRLFYGFHAGTIGVAANYAVVWLSRRLRTASSSGSIPRP
jgi:Na+/proline symporter